MGIGDEIMASGQAKLLYKKDPKPVLIVGIDGRPRSHFIWEKNPKIVQRILGMSHQVLVNGQGCRPYIAAKTNSRWTWKRFELEPGEIVLTQQELSWGKEYSGKVLVEPNVKVRGSNKDWGWDRWCQLAKMHPGLFIQVGDSGSVRALNGVRLIRTDNFRQAASILAYSKAFVGTEGALHHAAAALGIPAVVIFGGYISPDITGYPTHRNLFTGGSACGSRVSCSHCRTAMAAISVGEVSRNLMEVI